MKYAFNLGRVFTLSLAEIFAVFEQQKWNFRLVEFYREILIIETETELDVKKLQKRLGGTIKIMQILDVLGRKKMFGPSIVFKDYFDPKILKEKFLATISGKINLGISIYPMALDLPLRGENKRIGLSIKKILSVAGFSVRIVFPQLQSLSLPSVTVTNEHLLEKGAEIDFLVAGERIYIAKTLTVQDFEDYGRRDYQRPARDFKIGMLPPKVAQEMINLAKITDVSPSKQQIAILDPFAGSGTIVQEAIVSGYHAVGSDFSEKAIENAEKNLLWIKNRYKLPQGRYELILAEIKDIAENLPKYDFEAIITEGTLGPSYTAAPKENEIKKNFAELEKIYLQAFRSFKKILTPGKLVVIALPAYHINGRYILFQIIDKIKELGYDIITPLPEIIIEKFNFLQITERKSIIYDRKDQFVSREIFIFKNN